MFLKCLLIFGALSVSEAKIKTTGAILHEFGLTPQVYKVTTEDGYILKIFRIPNPGAIPVIVVPGFLSSSSTWVAGPKNDSLVCQLHHDGYDVWLANYRGNSYGREHKFLHPVKDASKFWDFSYHEIASLDLPAIIHLVETVTGKNEMLYVGHSMGCLLHYVMCTEKPEYCKKFRAVGFLAPVVFPPGRLDSLVIRSGIIFAKRFCPASRKLGVHELIIDEAAIKKIGSFICFTPFSGGICKTIKGLTGPSTEEIEETNTNIVSGISGTSMKLAEHMAQLMQAGDKVPKYSYGFVNNMKRYRSAQPPVYKGRISAPTFIFHSKVDPFTDKRAITLLRAVTNVELEREIIDPEYNHLNFVLGENTKRYVNDELLERFRKYKY